MRGPETARHHPRCGTWWGYTCDCLGIVVDFEEWEIENPARVPKNARPKMGEDGRSVRLLAKLVGRHGSGRKRD